MSPPSSYLSISTFGCIAGFNFFSRIALVKFSLITLSVTSGKTFLEYLSLIMFKGTFPCLKPGIFTSFWISRYFLSSSILISGAGIVTFHSTSRSLVFFNSSIFISFLWCGRRDLNPHD